jgi:energy-coupling factor transporter ATP-binding protein EcfA2
MNLFEGQNREAIRSLNQRGGRMLSLVDLLDAGTLNPEMAAEMIYVAVAGGSFLTAAGPGGTGKTTLMAAALAFLAPGTEIVTIEGPETLERLAAATPGYPQCLVAHEIGPADFSGYLWGESVARYFDVAKEPGRFLASNLHAETHPAAKDQLLGLGVSPRAFGWVSCLAFMAARGGRRRVTALWTTDGTLALSRLGEPVCGHRQTWQWQPEDDRFERLADVAPLIASTRGGLTAATVQGDLDRYRDFLIAAQAGGVHRMEDLRRRALDTLLIPS